MSSTSKHVTRMQRRLARRAAHRHAARRTPPQATLPEATTTIKIDPPVVIEHVTIEKVPT